jgi:predicted  nucleic acid-binding Zn-ribbon protein
MSLKNRLSSVEVKEKAIQKELYNLTTNIKTYKRETETLRHTKEAFEKAFDAKNADIRRSLTT